MDIIDRINKLIIDNKISELGLSSKIGIPQRSINYYMNRKQKPSLEFVKKITEAFNIDANWLLTGEGSMLKTAPDESIVSEPQGAYGGDTANLREKIEALELEVKDLKYQREVLKELIDVLKGSISDKDVIIDLLNEKVNTPIFVKEKSTPK